MSDIRARIRDIDTLEGLSSGRSLVHALHPLTKLASTLVFVGLVASFGRYDFIPLAPYLFYPFIMMALAELPYGIVLSRLLIALPFSFFAGLSGLIFDTDRAFSVGGFTVTLGALAFATILLKTYLCVMGALILIATTPFTELSAQLRRLHTPAVFVLVFELTYRYIGILLEEAYSMTIAYRLRSGGKKALGIKHVGAFVGLLLLRGFDRAERVYAAMCCRGYSLGSAPPSGRRPRRADALAFSCVCIPAVILRFYYGS